jgi:cysteine desulfurase
MAANNEIGTLQPIRLIGELAKKRGILFHTDAVQMYGQLPIQVNRDNIDMLSASAHKFHGPKGVGFLYARESVPIAPFILGGSQENHMRAGTQNVPSIVGMALAAKMTHETMQNRILSTAKKRDYLIRRILREIPFSRLNGDWKRRLPGNTNISFQFVNASELLALLDMKEICVSAGSACSSHSKKPSAVLTALGLPEEIVQGAIRMTLSDETTMKELDYVIDTLKELVADCRKNNDEYLAF